MIPIYAPPPELQALVQLPARPRLLVVDDQPTNIQLLNQIFHKDHEVFMAINGAQALEVAHRVRPDLILLDVVMPDMDGLAVCRELKVHEETANIPIIFVTSLSDPGDETQALEVGGVDFITKPVNPSVVRARVKTHLTLRAQSDLLRELVFRDGLTMVANRRCFDDSLQNEWRRCRRSASSMVLLMIDIDFFKRYNDRYGHQAGDACLQTVSATLMGCFGRSHDLVARYGGEEFVCLLPECDLAAGLIKAEEVRNKIMGLCLLHQDSPVNEFVTLSIGVAATVPTGEMQPDALLGAADEQLYLAKNRGRNCCSGVLYEGEPLSVLESVPNDNLVL